MVKYKRTIHSVDKNQCLPLAMPAIAHWVLEQSGHSDRDGGYTWLRHHQSPLTTANLATPAAASQVGQQQKPVLSL